MARKHNLLYDVHVHYLVLGRKPALSAWAARPFWPGVHDGPDERCNRDCYEREACVESPGPPEADGGHRRIAAAIMRYDIFAPRTVRGVLARSPVESEDTIGINYRFVPGLRLFFAARVVDAFDREEAGLWRTGFTYRTLVGHPEYGEETFCVEKDLASGCVVVALRSWSRPATWLARMTKPLVRRLQVSATNGALGHLCAMANEAQNC